MKQWQMNGVGLDQLALVETDIPQPGPGEVLVRVAAVSLNYRDKMVIETGMGYPLSFPLVPGSDMAGSVVATGDGVTRVQAGQRVISTFWTHWIDGKAPTLPGAALGGPAQGTLAQYVVLPQDQLVAAPQTLSDLEASTLTCAALTAWYALVEEGGLRAGQTVLVQGTGGVALFGAQIALAHGATVVATSSSEAKLDKVRELGVQHGVLRGEGWTQRVLDATGGRGVDQLIALGGSDLGDALDVLAPGGRASVIGLLGGPQFSGSVVPFLQRRLTIQGIGVGHRRALEDLVRAIDANGIKPVIDTVYGIEDLPAALAHVGRGAFGKVVVRLDR
ncbi:NAD(P)-dependent alcohol dehydrogenase [Jeongeupia sp. USM3]|uniref:zinc-dependent alcohol dehydrogenase family protein n=1 Tax=Jeongeupia sp. USM3 TaxID=1906741 RepID=UPI00089DE5D3|nr:NAD(P)-dependent alcohol dehydrogenase [Jeongeupia sp. USM3]AOY01738.1 alcohol dehydrogenase [Jeongeupia sp. USM3]